MPRYGIVLRCGARAKAKHLKLLEMPPFSRLDVQRLRQQTGANVYV